MHAIVQLNNGLYKLIDHDTYDYTNRKRLLMVK